MQKWSLGIQCSPRELFGAAGSSACRGLQRARRGSRKSSGLRCPARQRVRMSDWPSSGLTLACEEKKLLRTLNLLSLPALAGAARVGLAMGL